MTESHEIYRVFGEDVSGLVNQLNIILNLLSNRLDKLEGLRDDPAFFSSNFKYPSSPISGFLKASSTSDADFGSLAVSDLGLTTTEIEEGSVAIISNSINVSEMGDSFIRILDSNGTVLHQLGDEV